MSSQLLTQIYEFKGKHHLHIVSYCAGEKFSVSRDLRHSLVSEFANAIEYIAIPAQCTELNVVNDRDIFHCAHDWSIRMLHHKPVAAMHCFL